MQTSEINIVKPAIPFAPFELVDCVAKIPQDLIDGLKNGNLDPNKFKIVDKQSVVWNNGSLGAPMPGECYTQALVPGYRLSIQYGDQIFEVHTNLDQTSFAIPGYGFI